MSTPERFRDDLGDVEEDLDRPTLAELLPEPRAALQPFGPDRYPLIEDPWHRPGTPGVEPF